MFYESAVQTKILSIKIAKFVKRWMSHSTLDSSPHKNASSPEQISQGSYIGLSQIKQSVWNSV